jgi:hypothetical protein
MEDTQRAAIERYDWIGKYCEGRAVVELNGKWGVIDLDSNEVVPLKYDSVSDYRERRAIIRLNGRYGVVDVDGNEVMSCWYTDVVRHPYGFKASFRASDRAGEHLYFNLDGHLIAQQVND